MLTLGGLRAAVLLGGVSLLCGLGACGKENNVSQNNTADPCAGSDAGPEATTCGGACVDTNVNPAHCGQCDAACPNGAACTDGACGCPADQKVCSNACVDTNADSANCGQCGTVCSGGTTCKNGSCGCNNPGEKSCGATCIDTREDKLNCGDCGNKCDPGADCVGGNCTCPGAMGKVCGGTCVDTATSTDHCGDCNKPCDRLCVNGACPTIASVAVGSGHTCARLTDGSVACWGQNTLGELGRGSISGTPSFVPGVVSGLSGVTQLSAGGNGTCAIGNGKIYCWGNNDQKQLTSAAGEFEPAPFEVPALPIPAGGQDPDLPELIAVSGRFTCAGGGSGSVYCWGANDYGETGVAPSVAPVGVPTRVAGLQEVIGVSTGFTHACAITQDINNNFELKCWGDNRSGALGVDPSTANSSTPLALETPLGAPQRVAALQNSTCALNGGNTVSCWGSFWLTGLNDDTHTPELIGSLPNPTSITGAAGFACARVSGGEIWCWGADGIGAAGQETASTVPAAVLDANLQKLSGMDGVIAGQEHTCAWTPTNIWCWGSNLTGQLGNGDGGAGKTSVRAVKVAWH